MGAAAKTAFPDYEGGFVLGSTDIPILGIFHWSGVDWTPDIIIKRFAFFGIAIVIALAASIFFDRFDPSRSKPRRMKSTAAPVTPQVAATPQALSQPMHLTPLASTQNGFIFIRVLISELKLLLKGQRWWWYAGVMALFFASVVNKPEIVRAFILPIAWLLPILIWSGMGNREITNNTQQMVFSSAAPLMRQLPATWAAGFIVALVTGSGVALKLLGAGDLVGLLAWFTGALFIPSFALALGVWSNSHKLFEVVHVTVWYLVLNGLQAVDYFGANGNSHIGFFMAATITLIIVAFVGRARQLQN